MTISMDEMLVDKDAHYHPKQDEYDSEKVPLLN
jgi:hypothetical protein